MGGKLSFALAMLDGNNNGWIINAMHSREGCFTYCKEISNEESYYILSEEETLALNVATGKNGAKEAAREGVPITLIDKDYPDKLKYQYMPPFVIKRRKK